MVDFKGVATAKELLFWRIVFEHMLLTCQDTDAVEGICKRLCSQPALADFRATLDAFLQRQVGPWLAARAEKAHSTGTKSTQQTDTALQRLSAAHKVLSKQL